MRPFVTKQKRDMAKVELAQLRVFAAVAQGQSFRQAAKRLALSPSAVSQAVRSLEERVGSPLLLRSTRSVALTQAGSQLLAELEPALAQFDGMLDRASQWGERVQGRLKLNVPRSSAWLLMRLLLTNFLHAHPDVELEITTHDGLVDIVKDGYDAGIRFPETVPLDMVAVPIGSMQRFCVVASPEMAASARRSGKRLAHPTDLTAVPCVRLRFPSGVLYQWQFRRGDEALHISVNGPLTVDDSQLAAQAALDGVGWAYCNEFLVAEHLREGQLLTALDEWCPPEPGFQLYYPSRRQTTPALRALIAWTQQFNRDRAS